MPDDSNRDAVRTFGFRAPRFSVNFNFSFEVMPSRERYEAVCSDISEDGLAADLLQKLTVKTRVTMWLLFPGSTIPVQIQASVEYRHDRRHGFNFLYSSVDERAQVQAYIRSLST